VTLDAVRLELLRGRGLPGVERPDARAAELRQMPADAERFTHVARDGADVRPAAAVNAEARQRPFVV
jgi:hypothetical protein